MRWWPNREEKNNREKVSASLGPIVGGPGVAKAYIRNGAGKSPERESADSMQEQTVKAPLAAGGDGVE